MEWVEAVNFRNTRLTEICFLRDIFFSGSMDFEEYIMAINCTNFSEPKDKLTWIFNVFDEVKFDLKCIQFECITHYTLHITHYIITSLPLSGWRRIN